MSDISLEELQLAARNHGMPLEVLREPITPVGLHYLLVHYDIPAIDPATWRLEIGGAVNRPLSLSLDDLDTARKHASKWRDAGYGYLICGWPETGRAQVEAFARDVMPEFSD